jgi:imidazole glycerol-phosphate synthase subunit HisH
MIGIINLGISNLASLTNSFDHLGISYSVIESSGKMHSFDKLVLPGVGAFGKAMQLINERGMYSEIRSEVESNGKPLLGICLGLQLLFEESEESPGVKGLSLLEGKVVKVPSSNNYSIPRIGWADSLNQKAFLGLNAEDQHDFYYIHSFHAEPIDRGHVAITTGELTGAVQGSNIYGCQFHPEKSHLSGLRILKTFSELG